MSRPQEWNFQFDGNLPRNQTPPRPAATENSKPLLGHSQNEISHVSNHARQDNASFHLPNKRSGGWSWEFLSLAIIVGCFGGIITLLLALQNKPVPDWPSGITVNAVLSVLVTVMKGATGIIIAECLSQLKWRWFQRERRLIDFIIWDEASRGAWGARRLLLTPRGWFLGYLGAFAFLSAFIIGPTIQQTVEVRVRQVEMSINASVPLCNSSYYSIVGLGSGAGGNKLNLPMIGAVYNGFSQTSSQSPLRADCPNEDRLVTPDEIIRLHSEDHRADPAAMETASRNMHVRLEPGGKLSG